MNRAAQPSPDVEDELVDLQRRFHLLEGDRKAFMEASQWTIKQNKDTLELVKRENRELRAALSNLQKEKQRSRTEKSGLVTVEKLSEDVHELKKRCDLPPFARIIFVTVWPGTTT
jgi:phage-related protein